MDGLDKYGLPILDSKWVDSITGENVVVEEVCVYTTEVDEYDGVEVDFSSDVFGDLGSLCMDLDNFLDCYKWVSHE